MSLLEKITDLISQVSNEGEKTDKRKLIDEVAGMMKSAGCDDEVIRTAIGKMEKIGYDESEAGTSDNCKAKNEDDEDVEEEEFEEEKEIASNKKKAKNEDDKEEDKKEDKKDEDKEEKADNKCKNSMDDVKRAIFGGSSKVENTGYISQAKRLEMGNKY